MRYLSLLWMSLSSLGNHKLRAGLALLGIIIGVSAVISLMAIGRGVQESITSRITDMGADLIYITPGEITTGGVGSGQGSSINLTVSDSEALIDSLNAPSILAAAPEISSREQAIYRNSNTNVTVYGVTDSYFTVHNLDLHSGMFVNEFHSVGKDQVVVLGANVSDILFSNLSPIGQVIRLGNRRFKVVGLMESEGGGFRSRDNSVFVPLSTAYYRLSSVKSVSGKVPVDRITIKSIGPEDVDPAILESTKILRITHGLATGIENDFSISSLKETQEALEETTNTLVLFLGSIAGISLLVGGIGIMNIMIVSVTERTREIGVRKAVGARKIDVMLQFLFEAVLLSLSGGILGIVVSFLVIQVLGGVSFSGRPLQPIISADITLMSLAVATSIGMFFGIYPAVRAAALHPIEALRAQ